MLALYPIEVLESNPRWQTLVSLHSSLKKVLPPEYLAQYVDAVATPLRKKRSPTSVDFNGMLVIKFLHNLHNYCADDPQIIQSMLPV